MAPRRRTKSAIAAAVGVSRRTLSNYERAGCDVTSLPAIRRHMATLRHGGTMPAIAARGSPLAAARLALTNARADKAELECRRLHRELVSVDEVRGDLASIRDAVKVALAELVDTLPARLAGLGPPEMERVIAEHTSATLARLADADTYATA